MAKILIVDDAAFTRNLLKITVECGGHEVVGCARNGKQGFDLFKNLHPDIVTLDYLMPDRSGEVVLKQIIGYDPKARVIMLSGSDDHTLQERTMQNGAKCYLKKPCAMRDILKAIGQVMEV